MDWNRDGPGQDLGILKPAASSLAQQARFIFENVPPGGLFAGQEWRISPFPFHLSSAELKQLELLGRILLQFNRAVNLLYRQAVAGKKPAWILDWLDQGKSPEILEWQRSEAFKNELPQVLRPDLLLTENGFSISEL